MTFLFNRHAAAITAHPSLAGCLLGLALTLSSSLAVAHEYTAGAIRIVHPWARATVPGASTGGAYFKLENKGEADRLLSVSGGPAEAAEIHSMSMQGNVMKMEKLEKGLELPRGKLVELKPGGMHVMLLNLKARLKEGQSFPLKLKFEKAGEVTVDVKVDGLATPAPTEHKH